MDMNNRKAENRSDQKSLDIDIEEINNKFTISLGDLRTEIESAKWDATRRAISTSRRAISRGCTDACSHHRAHRGGRGGGHHVQPYSGADGRTSTTARIDRLRLVRRVDDA